MELKKLLDILEREEDDMAIAKLIDDNFLLFVDNENAILPFLNSMVLYCTKMNSGYLSLVFSNVHTSNRKYLNKIFDICLNSFYDIKSYYDVLDNLTSGNGTFVYEYDYASYDSAVDIFIGYVKKTNKYIAFKTNYNSASYLVILSCN